MRGTTLSRRRRGAEALFPGYLATFAPIAGRKK